MTEEKSQKFTSKVRRGLTWVSTVSSTELARVKQEAGGGRIPGMTAAQLSDIEAALLWIRRTRKKRMGKGDRRTQARKVVRGFVRKVPPERSSEEKSKSRKGEEESLGQTSMHRSTKPAKRKRRGLCHSERVPVERKRRSFFIQSSARERDFNCR